MVQPTEQLEGYPDNLYERLVEAVTQANQSFEGKIDLPTIEFDNPNTVTLEDVRSRVEELLRKK